MTIPTSQSGADNEGKKPSESEREQASAQKLKEQSEAAIENMSEGYDGGSGIGGLKPEAGETRVVGQSDPTGTKR